MKEVKEGEKQLGKSTGQKVKDRGYSAQISGLPFSDKESRVGAVSTMVDGDVWEDKVITDPATKKTKQKKMTTRRRNIFPI